MDFNSLEATSPIDGRYLRHSKVLSQFFSESALIFNRIKIEVLYLIKLSEFQVIRDISKKEKDFLHSLYQPTIESAQRVKEIEKETHHDVKAIEYFLKENFQKSSLEDLIPFIHFGVTSDDINNLSYRIMTQQALEQILKPKLIELLKTLNGLSQEYKDLAMLARTHGQAAIPTTLGKEISVFSFRLLGQIKRLDDFQLTGKLNGAVGGYHSFTFALPQFDWPELSKSLVSELGLKWQLNTTQINSADDLVELFSIFHLINSILIGLDQDMWRYISDDYLVQKNKKDKVGSSTMPQKINPIEFENSEGNLTLANGFYETLSRKLPISRLQRDLSDSTVLRNLGTTFAFNLIGINSLIRGLNTIKANQAQISKSLTNNWNILAEALNVKLRAKNQPDSYELAAKKMKNKQIDQSQWQAITAPLDDQLAKLTPKTYLGLSQEITQETIDLINNYLENHPHD